MKSLSRVKLSATPWTAAFQAPPSMGFYRQKYWNGVPLPSQLFSLPVCNKHHTHLLSVIPIPLTENHPKYFGPVEPENGQDREPYDALSLPHLLLHPLGRSHIFLPISTLDWKQLCEFHTSMFFLIDTPSVGLIEPLLGAKHFSALVLQQ